MPHGAGPASVDPIVELTWVEPDEVANSNEWDLPFGDEASNLAH